MRAAPATMTFMAALMILITSTGLAQDRGYLAPAAKPAKKPASAVSPSVRRVRTLPSANPYTTPIRSVLREQLGLFGKTSREPTGSAGQRPNDAQGGGPGRYSTHYSNPLANYTGAQGGNDLFLFWIRDYTSDLPKQQVTPVTSPEALFRQPYSLSGLTGPAGIRPPYATAPQRKAGAALQVDGSAGLPVEAEPGKAMEPGGTNGRDGTRPDAAQPAVAGQKGTE